MGLGFIGKAKEFMRRMRGGDFFPQVRSDNGSALQTHEYFAPAGDDSPPLNNDYLLLVPIVRTGSFSAVGAIDPKNAGQAAQGEKRFYARNGDGRIVSTVWMYADGSITIENGSGQIYMQSSGAVIINGVEIGTDGSISTPGSVSAQQDVTAAGISLMTHTHPIAWTDPAGSGISGVPIP